MNFLYRCLLILLACAALLAGVQLPGFVDQYGKRVNAHLIEAQTNLRGWQEIADRDFGGSLPALIARHESSSDLVFRQEAQPLTALYARYRLLQEQRNGLATSFPGELEFLAGHGDRALLNETFDEYSFTVPLDGLALECGLAAVAVVVIAVELLVALLGALSGSGARRRHA